MCPVNTAAFRVVIIFAVKLHRIADSQAVKAWCDVDIVRDKQRLFVCKFQDKPLMSVTFVVVIKQCRYNAAACNLHVALNRLAIMSSLFVSGFFGGLLLSDKLPFGTSGSFGFFSGLICLKYGLDE